MIARNDSIMRRGNPTGADANDVAAQQAEAKSGAPARVSGGQKAQVKERVSIRLDADLVAALRASGPGWQTRVNNMLRRQVLQTD